MLKKPKWQWILESFWFAANIYIFRPAGCSGAIVAHLTVWPSLHFYRWQLFYADGVNNCSCDRQTKTCGGAAVVPLSLVICKFGNPYQWIRKLFPAFICGVDRITSIGLIALNFSIHYTYTRNHHIYMCVGTLLVVFLCLFAPYTRENHFHHTHPHTHP